jgi:hypothetical protein
MKMSGFLALLSSSRSASLKVRRYLRGLIATLLLTAIRSLSSRAMYSTDSPRGEAGFAAIATIGVRSIDPYLFTHSGGYVPHDTLNSTQNSRGGN